ncbi:MAG: fatty acyl-AMP ligase, partial [Gammaproteobacteria bacterium]
MPVNLVGHIIDIVSMRSNQTAFIFLADGEVEKDRLTYFDLDLKARALAAELQKHAKAGDRILLSYLPGIDFIIAFIGCLYAGMIAVPAYPLRNNRHAKRLLVMLNDCEPRLVLGTADSLSIMQAQPEFSVYHYILTDSIADEMAYSYRAPIITSDMLAFLQYTSGSTGLPKGVMVSHENIVANMQALEGVFSIGTNAKIVSWLPMQHDMGLVGQMLYSLYMGATEIIMSPAAFLEKPSRWLRAISHYQGFMCGGPNFGYQLCIEKITEQETHGLDLSCWKAAFNGSEPVRATTLQDFSKKFTGCNFNFQAFLPCYGMAETTLIISGKPRAEMPIISAVKQTALVTGHLVKDEQSNYLLVSSGQVYASYVVKIVNPDTQKLAEPNEIGEVWVRGPSVAQGYWNKPEATQEIFRATLQNDPHKYLRTGDLGYLDGPELYITGRLKDIIILQGRNVYPQDVEQAVEECHSALRIGHTAAFAVEVNEQEQLVIVAEVERTYRKIELKPVFRAIR